MALAPGSARFCHCQSLPVGCQAETLPDSSKTLLTRLRYFSCLSYDRSVRTQSIRSDQDHIVDGADSDTAGNEPEGDIIVGYTDAEDVSGEESKNKDLYLA